MTGRARGRGVARGRGAPPSAGSSAAPPRRPGTGPAPQAQQVPAQVLLISLCHCYLIDNT